MTEQNLSNSKIQELLLLASAVDMLSELVDSKEVTHWPEIEQEIFDDACRLSGKILRKVNSDD